MLELDAANAIDYLRRAGRGDGVIRVDELSGGVSNIVLRVTTEVGLYVLKQSRPQLRTKQAWFSDLERVYREQEVMQALAPLLPGVVPEVLWTDRANYVFAMSHAPLEAHIWKQELLAGRIDLNLGERVGRTLGTLHQATASDPGRFEAFRDPRVFDQLRIDPFYRRVQERLPDVAIPIGRLVDSMLTREEAICHGDYTPKNMLVHGAEFTLVDYETAYFGDPAMDLGLCLAHLVLKAFAAPERAQRFWDLTDAFWKGYHQEAVFRPAAELEERGIAHLGACLLARTDGTSPVDYLDDDSRAEARRCAREILLAPLRTWNDVRRLRLSKP